MPKPLALFIDGTWNHADAPHPTNVWRLYERLREHTPFAKCPHWYLDGVGTEGRGTGTPPVWERAAALRRPGVPGRAVRTLLGGAAGYGVGRLIRQGYAFLCAHHQPGDQVFLFGFSRGAFIARSLAGFMAEVGLLLKDHLCDVEKAYALYVSKDSRQRYRLRRHLRRLTGKGRPSTDERLPVHLLGLWDTVEAHGLPRALQLLPSWRTDHHRIGIPAFVTHVRHALALHECRPSFEPTLFEETLLPHQSLQQRWFAGAHADVGGGYADRPGLPTASLQWMADEAHALGLPVNTACRTCDASDLVPVHHEVRGLLFGWRLAQVRRALRAVVQTDPRQVASHSLAPQAAARLLALGQDPYPFARVDVADACQHIDLLSAALALRRAQALGAATVSDWQGLGLGELSGAVDRLTAVATQPVKTLLADRQRVQRDLLLLAVLGDVPVFERLRGDLLAFGDRCHQLTDPPMRQAAVHHIDRLIDLLQVPAWAAAVAAANQAEALLVQLTSQRAMLARTQARRRPP